MWWVMVSWLRERADSKSHTHRPGSNALTSAQEQHPFCLSSSMMRRRVGPARALSCRSITASDGPASSIYIDYYLWMCSLVNKNLPELGSVKASGKLASGDERATHPQGGALAALQIDPAQAH